MNPLKCRLLRVNCYKASEQDGDEAYIKLNGLKIWPEQEMWYKMMSNSEALLDVLLPLNNSSDRIVLDLFDSDNFFDDKIGSFVLDLSTPGGPFTTDLSSKSNDARYSMTWEAYR